MSIAESAINRNRVTLVMLFLVFIGGYQAFERASRNLDPGFLVRVANVSVRFPGASPERVEELVTSKLEEKIMEIPELDFVRSESTTGMSQVYVNIREEYTELRPIWDDLRRKVDSIKSSLPAEVTEVKVNDEYGDVFGIVIGLTGDGYSYAELKNIADYVKDEFIRLPEAAKVEIFGEQEERIFVEYNNARLSELGLSPLQLSSILASRNILISGGDIQIGDERISLEPSGNFESVEDLGNTVINVPNSREVVYLKDVVSITRGYIDPPRSYAHASGVPGLVMAISMKDGGNYIKLGDQVKGLLDQLNQQYPIGVQFSVLYLLPDDIIKKIDEFTESLIQAVVIVIAVMLLFLGVRTGLIVGSLIPGAILLALFVMGMLGIGLDQMSLSALIIALGLLVDNAIVMTESAMVRMERGVSAFEAAVESARELKIPLLTSSLTTAAAFLPIYLAESAVGEYTAPLFKVVTITLLSSWLLSITMIPMLCVLFLKVKVQVANVDDLYQSRFYQEYRKIIEWILRRKGVFLGGVVAAFLFGVFLLGLVPNIFFPDSDQTAFQVNLELPVGTDIGNTREVVERVEQFMQSELRVSPERPLGVTEWQTHIGSGGPRFTLGYSPPAPAAEAAVMVVRSNDYEAMLESIDKLDAYLRDNFPNVSPVVKALGNGPSRDYPVEVRLSGQDTNKLFGLVETVKQQLRETPGVRLVNDDWGARTKKLLVKINQPRAHRAGVTNEDIARSLQTGLSGLKLTQYREGDTEIPVILRSVAADRQDIGKLESINVYVQASGVSVPLSQVADIDVVWEPNKVIRRDNLRTVTVRARLEPGVLASEVNGVIMPWLEQVSTGWGLGYRYEMGGEVETAGKANKSIGDQLPTAGMIILLLMVMQFNSIRRPLIILLTIPLGIIGVAIGLNITFSNLGFMTFLGIISLSGIIINNAIVLIDRIDIEISENGLTPYNAIIESCLQRLRPILLTTATTILGLLPLWLAGGAMFQTMAVAIIFGLAFATALTLGVVPALYALLFKVQSD